MSRDARREYLQEMQRRYQSCASRRERSRIIDAVADTLNCHRKSAIRCLHRAVTPRRRVPRPRPLRYLEALPAIQLVWEALDYPCAERLHPVLLPVAEQLAAHGELYLDEGIRQQLAHISRATLARRLAQLPTDKPRRLGSPTRVQGLLRAEVPVGHYDYREQRPGALEADLVEHNGGSSVGHFAYTLHVVDVVTAFSRRRAILGRSQRAVFEALQAILDSWPYEVWALHTDNGSEFLHQHLLRFCRARGLQFIRSRPYCKNDQPYVEQKNRQLVRETVGYARYDTPEAVAWLNAVYELLDPYVNLFLPVRKVVAKTRAGHRVRKHYDLARTPWDRVRERAAVDAPTQAWWEQQRRSLNPLALHRQLERLLAAGPPAAGASAPAAPEVVRSHSFVSEPVPVR